MKKEIKIINKYNNKIILCGKYESIKDCLEKNRGANLEDAYLVGADLRGADLEDAYLVGADLRGADLRGANLEDAYLVGADLVGADLVGADLRKIKNYYNSHDFFIELIRRKNQKDFTERQWAIIGKILVHRLCWDKLIDFSEKEMLSIGHKLKKDGFGEYLKKYRDTWSRKDPEYAAYCREMCKRDTKRRD